LISSAKFFFVHRRTEIFKSSTSILLGQKTKFFDYYSFPTEPKAACRIPSFSPGRAIGTNKLHLHYPTMSLLLSLSLLTLTHALPQPNNFNLQNPSSITKRATAHLYKRYYTYSVLGSVISLVFFVILVACCIWWRSHLARVFSFRYRQQYAPPATVVVNNTMVPNQPGYPNPNYGYGYGPGPEQLKNGTYVSTMPYQGGPGSMGNPGERVWMPPPVYRTD
jgi:hypothetical protein